MLDLELMIAMGERIEELERRGGLPRVDIDLAHLRNEHQDRQGWQAKCLDRLPTTDWDAVRQGSHHLLEGTPPADTTNGPKTPGII